MSNAPARVVVWDPDTGNSTEEVELRVLPAVRDLTNDAVVFYLSQGGIGAPDDLVVPQEWVGKKLFVEVSPSVVTSSSMLDAVVQTAKNLGVPVG